MTDRTADRLAAGLALCADTEKHVAEWNARKAHAEATRPKDYAMPDGSRTADLKKAIEAWGPEFDKMLRGEPHR